MKILKLSVGKMGTNCYLVLSVSKHAAIIDPGADAEKIIEVLEQNSADPAMILLTHGHFDHIGALWELSQCYAVPIYIHEDDAEMLTDPEKSLCSMMNGEFHPITGVNTYKDEDEIAFDELNFRVLHTPGHTKGSSVFLVGEYLFSGDTLFQGGIGRYDFYGGDFDTIKASLQRLAALPGDYIVHPGHGANTTLLQERQGNPYLSVTDHDADF